MEKSEVYTLDFLNQDSKDQLANLINSNSSPEVIEFTDANGEKQYLVKDETNHIYYVVNKEKYEEYEKNKDIELLEDNNIITEDVLIDILTPNLQANPNELPVVEANKSSLEEEIDSKQDLDQETIPESTYGDFMADIALLSRAYESILDMRLGIGPCMDALEYTPVSFPGESLNGKECSSAKISLPKYSNSISVAISSAKGVATTVDSKIGDLVNIVNNQIETFKTEQNEASDLLDYFLMTITMNKLNTEVGQDLVDMAANNIDLLPTEYIQYLVGQMDKEQYDEFIVGVKNYYDNEIKVLEYNIKQCEDILEDINVFAVDKGFAEGILAGADSYYNQMGYNLAMAGIEFSPEDLLKLNKEEKKIFLDKLVAEQYKEKYQIETYEELIRIKNQLETTQIGSYEGINEYLNRKGSAEYDYLPFLKDFNDYKLVTAKDVGILGVDLSYQVSSGNKTPIPTYNYNKYYQEHPEISEFEYMVMVQQKHLSQDFEIIGLNGTKTTQLLSDLKEIGTISEYNPNFLKTYSYLYKQDPETANKYKESIQYQINDIKGQIEANNFLKLLGEKDNKREALDFLWNGLAVKTEGLGDGLSTFTSGINYAIESIFTLAGAKENRILSSEEYKKRYILQALLSKEDKEKLGLIEKDENGSYTTTLPYQVIDYTKEYRGFFLNDQYEISQGIGNMLPSMLISTLNPAAGSIALAISSGGNSYHNAMVEGSSYGRSLLYGIASGCTEAITERFLGGLPGLSDVEVTDLITYGKSMFKEGMEEFYQDYIDMIYESMILGKEIEIPKTKEEWIEAANNRKKTFLYGAITAGIMQSPNLVTFAKSKINTYVESSLNESLDFDMLSPTIDEGIIENSSFVTYNDRGEKLIIEPSISDSESRREITYYIYNGEEEVGCVTANYSRFTHGRIEIEYYANLDNPNQLRRGNIYNALQAVVDDIKLNHPFKNVMINGDVAPEPSIIFLSIDTDNIASHNLAEKAGFHKSKTTSRGNDIYELDITSSNHFESTFNDGDLFDDLEVELSETPPAYSLQSSIDFNDPSIRYEVKLYDSGTQYYDTLTDTFITKEEYAKRIKEYYRQTDEWIERLNLRKSKSENESNEASTKIDEFFMKNVTVNITDQGSYLTIPSSYEDLYRKQVINSFGEKYGGTEKWPQGAFSSLTGTAEYNPYKYYLDNYTYQAQVGPITFASTTKEGLSNMISNYNDLIQSNPNIKWFNASIATNATRKVYITDLADSIWSDKLKTSYNNGNITYLSPTVKKGNDNAITTLHELNHGIDSSFSKGVKESKSTKLLDDFQNNDNYTLPKDYDYIFESPEMQDMFENYDNYIKRGNERVRAFEDILDAISGGLVHDVKGFAGHGVDTFQNKDTRKSEVFANIGALIINNEESILYNFLPSDLSNNLVNYYVNRAYNSSNSNTAKMIDMIINPSSKEMTTTEKIRNFEESFYNIPETDSEQLLALGGPEGFKYYMNLQIQENSEIIDDLIDYQLGNKDTMNNQNVQDFVDSVLPIIVETYLNGINQ